MKNEYPIAFACFEKLIQLLDISVDDAVLTVSSAGLDKEVKVAFLKILVDSKFKSFEKITVISAKLYGYMRDEPPVCFIFDVWHDRYFVLPVEDILSASSLEDLGNQGAQLFDHYLSFLTKL